jgi:hypothetical protein
MIDTTTATATCLLRLLIGNRGRQCCDGGTETFGKAKRHGADAS